MKTMKFLVLSSLVAVGFSADELCDLSNRSANAGSATQDCGAESASACEDDAGVAATCLCNADFHAPNGGACVADALCSTFLCTSATHYDLVGATKCASNEASCNDATCCTAKALCSAADVKTLSVGTNYWVEANYCLNSATNAASCDTASCESARSLCSSMSAGCTAATHYDLVGATKCTSNDASCNDATCCTAKALCSAADVKTLSVDTNYWVEANYCLTSATDAASCDTASCESARSLCSSMSAGCTTATHYDLVGATKCTSNDASCNDATCCTAKAACANQVCTVETHVKKTGWDSLKCGTDTCATDLTECCDPRLKCSAGDLATICGTTDFTLADANDCAGKTCTAADGPGGTNVCACVAKAAACSTVVANATASGTVVGATPDCGFDCHAKYVKNTDGTACEAAPCDSFSTDANQTALTSGDKVAGCVYACAGNWGGDACDAENKDCVKGKTLSACATWSGYKCDKAFGTGAKMWTATRTGDVGATGSGKICAADVDDKVDGIQEWCAVPADDVVACYQIGKATVAATCLKGSGATKNDTKCTARIAADNTGMAECDPAEEQDASAVATCTVDDKAVSTANAGCDTLWTAEECALVKDDAAAAGNGVFAPAKAAVMGKVCAYTKAVVVADIGVTAASCNDGGDLKACTDAVADEATCVAVGAVAATCKVDEAAATIVKTAAEGWTAGVFGACECGKIDTAIYEAATASTCTWSDMSKVYVAPVADGDKTETTFEDGEESPAAALTVGAAFAALAFML